MLDAAIGPRLDANSFRIRRVFSAAGTFEVTFASVSATAFSDVSPSSWPCVRDTVLKLESHARACCAVKDVRCPVYQTIRCGAGTTLNSGEDGQAHFSLPGRRIQAGYGRAALFFKAASLACSRSTSASTAKQKPCQATKST